MQQPLGSQDAAAEVSVVIPLYNEEGNVRPLYEELVRALAGLGRPWEVCFVDDGSRDGTWDQLLDVAGDDSRVILVRFSRNFGQTTALAAGIRSTTGRIIVTLDGDLQNNPADIPRLLDVLERGYDVVHGRRQRRQDSFWTRRLPSLAANWLIRRVTGTEVRDLGCALRVMRRELAERLELIGEMHRFIPVMADSLGALSVEIDVQHRPRSSGRTKYGLGRTFRVLRDLAVLASLSRGRRTPMSRFSGSAVASGLLGIGLMFCGIVGIAGSAAARTAFLLAGEIAWFSSVAMWNLGLLAEHLVRGSGWEKNALPLYRIVAPGSESVRSAVSPQISPMDSGRSAAPPAVIPFLQAKTAHSPSFQKSPESQSACMGTRP
ncbi:MAG: glycosyltransferase family 2 protein [Thermogutta sp.]